MSAIEECIELAVPETETLDVIAQARAELTQLRARIAELTEQSESWRRGVVAWQGWADSVIEPMNQPDGGKLGDGPARECIGDELRSSRARIAELEKQWEEHCAFHGSESPHALQAALYRASDAESHCKALAEDRSALTAQVEALTTERDGLRAQAVKDQLDNVVLKCERAVLDSIPKNDAEHKWLEQHVFGTPWALFLKAAKHWLVRERAQVKP